MNEYLLDKILNYMNIKDYYQLLSHKMDKKIEEKIREKIKKKEKLKIRFYYF
jgi:hypothetical protein